MSNINNENAIACPQKTLIINYRALKIGGIETYLAKLIEYSTKNEYRVIWLTTPNQYEDTHFKSIVDHPLVEKVYVKGGGQGWLPHKKIKFQPDEQVTMISMEPINFMKAEKIRKYAKNVKSFYHFLALPHFTGAAYYPERTFKSKSARKHWQSFMKKYAQRLLEEDCIRAYSMKHLDFYEKAYGIEIENKQEKILKKINHIEDYPNEFFEEKARKRKESFEIVTCARFDFPHKGFLLGLVDDYGALKEKYPQLKLTIIGYGDGEVRLKEKISALSQEAQGDITLLGRVSPFDLRQHFERGQLNVGLAGALFDGAICALPSLCVRHYCEECQTYGFIHEIEGTYLRDDPAMELKPFVEKLISMSDDEYIELTKKDFARARELKTNQPSYIFEQKNKSSRSTLKGMGLKARIFNFLRALNSKLYKVPGCEQDETENSPKKEGGPAVE